MSKTASKVQTRLTMPGQIHKAYKVMLKLVNPKFVDKDKQIPLRILKNAKGIAFVTVVKAGFVWSGTLGSGIVIAKLPDGTWSGPSSVGVGGMGWGALIGASVTDSVIVLNNDLAVKAFSGHGQIKFGGSLSIAAGPVGREGDASAHVGDRGVAACYSYSHSRGLFAGISLQGAIFMTRDSDNSKFYGYSVKAADIMKGKVTPPEFEDLKRLYDVLNIVSKSETDNYSFRDPNMKSFRDSSGVSFHAGGAGAHKFDDADDDDDDIPSAAAASGFAWGEQAQDDDDIAFAKAFAATTIAEKSDELAPGWVKVTSEGGQPYYWHESTGKTQWEVPSKQPTAVAVAANLPPPPPKQDEALAPGWVQLTAGDGQSYYWNESLNITQWERPAAAPQKLASASVPTPTIPPRRQSSATNVGSIAAQAAARAPSSNLTQQTSFRGGSAQPLAQQTSFRGPSYQAALPSAQQAAVKPSSVQQAPTRPAPVMQPVPVSAAPRPSIPARPAVPQRPASLRQTAQASNPFDSM